MRFLGKMKHCVIDNDPLTNRSVDTDKIRWSMCAMSLLVSGLVHTGNDNKCNPSMETCLLTFYRHLQVDMFMIMITGNT